MIGGVGPDIAGGVGGIEHLRQPRTVILGDAVSQAGGFLEILGFTTRAWKGGQSRERWIQDGKPRNPGRLNDIRHIVFKGWTTPWEEAGNGLGLLLQEGLLKENVDGEAVAWAYHRALAVPAARRVILVLTDGAPVDDSTLSVNPPTYLEEHLDEVIEAIEHEGLVRLVVLGVDHDPARFYRRCATWPTGQGVDGLALAWELILGED